MPHKPGHLNYHPTRVEEATKIWGGQICYHDIRICMEKDHNPME